jgi:hypothetical protein
MRRLIQILRVPQLEPLPVMTCVFTELCGGFEDYDCTIKMIHTVDQLEDGGIIFMDDAAGNYIHHTSLHHIISQKCPTSVFICWYWQNLSYRPFQKMIHTGEFWLYLNETMHMYTYMTQPSFVPLKLRANDSPSKIGMYPRKVVRDYCFMGGGYRRDWVPAEYTGMYYVAHSNNYLSYDERRTIYLSSLFAFGFQSDENMHVGHLSQRIFEGLAYGCIVLCENKLAEDYTDGAVVYVSSKEDMVEKMKYYKENPEKVKEKQIQGYEWIKTHGTNRTSIALFLDKIKTTFEEEFDAKPIVSVNIMGGLGNQLFQIATAYAYAKKEKATLQIKHIMQNGNRPVYWETLLTTIKPYLVSSISSTLEQWHEPMATQYAEIGPLSSNGKYLNGYLQSSKYFYNDTIKQEIRALFRPDTSLLLAVQQKYQHLMENKDRVVIVHARRTDYLKAAACHGPLDGSYYNKALDSIMKIIPHPIFLLSSDDNTFWQEIKEDISVVYQHEHVILEGETDIHTFALLQQFQNVIMSNSTFIWWTTWLAGATTVIAPAKWFGPTGPSSYEDIYEAHWARI